MAVAGLPDLLAAGRNARTLTTVKTNFDRASAELVSGRKTDVVKAAGGDPIRLYAIERNLSLLEGRERSIDIAISRADLAQTALERVQAETSRIGVAITAAVELKDVRSAELRSADARAAFNDVVTTLNVRFGERAVFAGAAAPGPALAPAEGILAEIAARTAGAADAAAAIAAVEDYFADPAGFAATGYAGSTSNAAPAELVPGQRLDYLVRADRAEIVNSLRTLALAVVGFEGAFAGASDGARLEVMGEAARRGLGAVEGIALLRGELGVSEERLDQAKTRMEGERVLFERSKNAIVARDQFDAAAEFTALETQLALIFQMTARISSLSLANFLR